jgi:hypothetical protein
MNDRAECAPDCRLLQKIHFTEEQLAVMRGGLSVDGHRWETISKWPKQLKRQLR